LLLVSGGAAAIGLALCLVGGATTVGQAFGLLLLPAAGLLQDLWLVTAPPRFMLVDMRRCQNSSPT
jgi:hypothetical protein